MKAVFMKVLRLLKLDARLARWLKKLVQALIKKCQKAAERLDALRARLSAFLDSLQTPREKDDDLL